MENIFLKFSLGRTFLVLPTADKLRSSEIPYFIFFNEEEILRNFKVDRENLKEKNSLYLPLTKDGAISLGIEWNYYHTILIKDEDTKLFFEKNVLPLLKNAPNQEIKYIILVEKMPDHNSIIIDVAHKISSIFYTIVSGKYIPITYAPFDYTSLKLPGAIENPILSLGNYKNFTISYLKNGEILISPNFGELNSIYEMEAMEFTINSIVSRGKNNYRVVQEEDSYSIVNEFASRFKKIKTVNYVNHLYSHFANLFYENRKIDKMICVIFDNISYSSSDEIMGGEILVGNLKNIKIEGRWRPLPLPGGDIANIEPWRIALGSIKEATGSSLENIDLPLIKAVKDNPHHSYIFNAINQNVITYSLSSSMHHIVSGIGEMLFFEDSLKNYEFFELLVDLNITNNIKSWIDLEVYKKDEVYYIDTYQLIKKVLKEKFSGKDKKKIFREVISTLVFNTLKVVKEISREYETKNVGFTGEFFKHPRILEIFVEEFEKSDFKVFLPSEIPLDDSAISVGQLLYTYFDINSEA